MLYHYCSVESMFNIITSRKLWLSDVTQMNDSHENKWLDKYIIDVLKDPECRVNPIQQQRLFSVFDNLKEQSYAFCLSKHPDKLSQWRAYADNGCGVCIGFSESAFPESGQPPFHISNNNFFLNDIRYHSDEDITSYLKDLINNNVIQPSLKDNSSDNFARLVGVMISFSSISSLYKNPAFIEESEVRLSHANYLNPQTIIGTDDTPMQFVNQNVKISQRVARNRIISYCDYEINNQNSIGEIYLGPKTPLRESDLMMLLSRCGYPYKKIKIIPSSATYQ